ncbi:MAG: flagellar protein [Clostridium sp.]|nr:flagellar protein [Clostridium sp.]MCM1170669.1 flagellar protein [Clostridium sp.]MCM1209810.1 flagellar protein [Ruminococcus sp.]
MNKLNTRLLSIEQAAGMYLQNEAHTTEDKTSEGLSFREVLERKTLDSGEVKFSKHANKRLESRNITLSDTQLNRLNQGVGQAREKSINESLVMMDNLAFIVNVKNNTVVTALEQTEDSNVFTNIDGAVIV